ncbi:hypothetical protein JZ751_001904 [Albula glossodonta]|uniref:Uncharacterized protein n=1 Tax=Albula glossodonta TaxID=121402 RepID=A0A8T2P7E7_9TELE|nr:hypothetical protein JZ751_001904 [Albula glossodonta]
MKAQIKCECEEICVRRGCESEVFRAQGEGISAVSSSVSTGRSLTRDADRVIGMVIEEEWCDIDWRGWEEAKCSAPTNLSVFRMGVQGVGGDMKAGAPLYLAVKQQGTSANLLPGLQQGQGVCSILTKCMRWMVRHPGLLSHDPARQIGRAVPVTLRDVFPNDFGGHRRDDPEVEDDMTIREAAEHHCFNSRMTTRSLRRCTGHEQPPA